MTELTCIMESFIQFMPCCLLNDSKTLKKSADIIRKEKAAGDV